MKVLLVDDEQDIRILYEEYFIERGDTVVTARDGEQAWQIIEQSSSDPFDTILTDHRMPKMTGIEMIKKLRHHGYKLPIVMMSGDEEASTDSELLNDILELIHKPARIGSLDRIFDEIAANITRENNVVAGQQELPASEKEIAPVVLPVIKPVTNDVLITKVPRARILVVDDEPEIRRLLCQILEIEDYVTVNAKDGVDGFAKWHDALNNNNPFDLVITDLMMPNMNGTQLLHQIRKLDTLVPTIVLTGHAELNEAYLLLQDYQIADFLSKPLKSTGALLFSVKNGLEKAQLQKNLLVLNAELELRVVERTQALKLETERAKKANQAKSDFLNRMSHELNTPLNAILGFTQLQEFQLESKNYEQMKQSLPLVFNAGRHLLRLIDDVLDIEKLENGELDISLGRCDLDCVIADCLSLVEKQVEKASLTIHSSTTGLGVVADESRLKQVLVNLLFNAVKFNREGGSITINVIAVANDKIEISVSDTGVGIASEDLALMFEPFTRLKYADDKVIDGVGNGLAICKLLVVEMNGSIKAASVLGQGSEFKVLLPGSNPQVPVQSEADNSKPSVLYIEDDPVSIQLIQMLFNNYPNIDFHVENNALDGIKTAQLVLPDVIILDINLPNMDGIEIMTALRVYPEFTQTVFVALSALALPAEIDKALTAGFVKYLTKPINIVKFMSAICSLLAIKQHNETS